MGHVVHPSLTHPTAAPLDRFRPRPQQTAVSGQLGRSGTTLSEWQKKTAPQKMGTKVAVWDKKTRRTYALPVGFSGATSVDQLVAARRAAAAATARLKPEPTIHDLFTNKNAEMERLRQRQAAGYGAGGLGLGDLLHLPVSAAEGIGRGVAHTFQGLGAGVAESARPTGADTAAKRRAETVVPRLATQVGNVTLGPSLTAAVQGRQAGGLGVGLDVALLPLMPGPFKSTRALIAGGRALRAGEEAGLAARAAYHGPSWTKQILGHQAVRSRLADNIINLQDRVGAAERRVEAEHGPLVGPDTSEPQTYTIPKTFYDDHRSRDLPEIGHSNIVKETNRHYHVEMDHHAYDDLLGDANYYTDAATAQQMGLSGLASSARHTGAALWKQGRPVVRAGTVLDHPLVQQFGEDALRGGKNWEAFSRARGYTDQEINDFKKWQAFNKRYPGLEPDMVDEVPTIHLANTERDASGHYPGGYIEKPAVHLRFGDLPEGKSWNHLAGQEEPGVSVYGAWKDPKTGKYVMESGNDQYLLGQGERLEHPIYEVKGPRIADVGEDGEPLLHHEDVSVVRRVHPNEVVTAEDPWRTITGHELEPHETPNWHEQEKWAKSALQKASPTAIREHLASFPNRFVTHEGYVQAIPSARSGVTQGLIERPAEWASQAMMGEGRVASAARKLMPTASAEARVARHAGRDVVADENLRRTMMGKFVQNLPKEGSDEDIAHFWYHQLPDDQMNEGGLVSMHDLWTNEMKKIQSGERLKTIEDELAALKEELKNATQDERWDIQSRIGELNIAAEDIKSGRLPQDLGASLHRLGQVIESGAPEANPDILNSMRALSRDRENTLVSGEMLTPEGAQTRRNLVRDMLGMEGDGAEYVGHRLERGRRTVFPGLGGYGRPKIPAGLSKKNELVLATTGRLKQSTHVVADDWRAAETYRNALRTRDDLARMGKPFKGLAAFDPENEVLINPQGRPVPAYWKRDELANQVRLGANDSELRKSFDEMMQGFQGKGTTSDAERVVDDARESGVNWDELRVVPKDTAERYYRQFARVPVGKGWGRFDKYVVDPIAFNLVFGRLGYIPKNVVQNTLMIAPHQGVYALSNIPRAVKLWAKHDDPLDKELYDHLANQVGVGLYGTIAQEAGGKILRKTSEAVTKVADLPLRMSSFIHEAAAEGVIAKGGSVLTQKDKQALIDLVTDPAKVNQLRDIRSRATEAMADFSRLTPTQRQFARRMFIIPNWLWAGSRYPVHFAATHPGRSAALAYLAAGEPGMPGEVGGFKLPKNKPLNEYMAKDLPSYAEGIKLPGNKLLRTGSISPYSTPGEVAMSATSQLGHTPSELLNPFWESASNIAHNTIQMSSGETKKTTLWRSLYENLPERFFPTVKFATEMIKPPSGEGRMYPDTSRLGQLKKELGVVPIKYDPDAALRTKYNQAGLRNSAQAVQKLMELKTRLEASGLEMDDSIRQLYDRRIKRQEKIEQLTLQGHTGLDFQQRAMKIDADLLLKSGDIDKSQRDAIIADALASDTAEQIKGWREAMLHEFYGGKTLDQIREYLRAQEGQRQAAAAGR